jgi:hypothetical protein
MQNPSWLLVLAAVAAVACSSNDLAVNPCPLGVNPAACGGLSVGGSTEEISTVLVTNPYSRPAIGLPDTVHAGVPFTVTFYTTYMGCVTPDGEMLMTGSRLTAIIPMETVRRVPGEMCPAYVMIGPRSAEMTLSDVGTDTVRVVGRIGDFGASTVDMDMDMDTVSANVVVLP